MERVGSGIFVVCGGGGALLALLLLATDRGEGSPGIVTVIFIVVAVFLVVSASISAGVLAARVARVPVIVVVVVVLVVTAVATTSLVVTAGCPVERLLLRLLFLGGLPEPFLTGEVYRSVPRRVGEKVIGVPFALGWRLGGREIMGGFGER